MNYSILGSVGRPHYDASKKKPAYDDDEEEKLPLAKIMLGENRRRTVSRRLVNQQLYMDKMKKNLNQCTAKHITPYWRNHPSMKGNVPISNESKGWCSMNYPTVL